METSLIAVVLCLKTKGSITRTMGLLVVSKTCRWIRGLVRTTHQTQPGLVLSSLWPAYQPCSERLVPPWPARLTACLPSRGCWAVSAAKETPKIAPSTSVFITTTGVLLS